MNALFNKWNEFKKNLQKSERSVYAYPREVWWCSLGINLGSETNGKNENFERPVLVVRVYNKEMMLVIPLTSREKQDKFHFSIPVRSVDSITGIEETKNAYVKLTQARVISSKRLARKIDTIPEEFFDGVREALKDFI